jgi:hypothetical protein
LIQQISRFQADTAVSAVLLENAPKDDTLVDSVRLKTILGDIPHATNRLLQDPEMELPLPADVVFKDIRDGDKRIFPRGEEYLGGSVIESARLYRQGKQPRPSIQLVKVQSHSKVVEDIRRERSAEQQLALVQVAKQLQRVRIRGVLAQDGACLEHELVCAKVLALKKHKLVLVREV